MSSKKKKCWTQSVGEYGTTVRVGERYVGSVLYIFSINDAGKLVRRSLGHRDRALAQKQALEISLGLGTMEGSVTGPLTVGTLIDIYMAKGLTGRGATYVSDRRRQLRYWREFLGDSRPIRSLSRSDVSGFIAWRTARSRVPLSNTTIWHDWKALDGALNFATMERNERGIRLLETNPLKGQVKLPKTVSPNRPVATDTYFDALLHVSSLLPWQFGVALVLGWETGHRIGAICQLTWADVDLSVREDAPEGSILWRADSDKVQNEHRVAITPKARAALLQAMQNGIKPSTAPVLPSPTDATKALERRLGNTWLRKAEKHAGIAHEKGRAWHALRRGWASERILWPDVAVAAAGGWKDTKTMKTSYQRVNAATIRSVVFAKVG